MPFNKDEKVRLTNQVDRIEKGLNNQAEILARIETELKHGKNRFEENKEDHTLFKNTNKNLEVSISKHLTYHKTIRKVISVGSIIISGIITAWVTYKGK